MSTTAGLSRAGRKPVADPTVLAAAAWELFERDGFDATTMSAIAEKAGVSRRTLFNHVPSKEALLFPGLDSYMQDFARVLSSRPVDEPVLSAMKYVIRELSASTGAIERAYPCGIAVREARLRPDSLKYANEQFAYWMNNAILLWLGDSPATRIKAGLVSALAAQVWTEMARIQAEEGATIEASLDRAMAAVNELFR